jgi:hypothetical protein
MVWIILIVVVAFLIATAMPLIRQNQHDKKQESENQPESGSNQEDD